MVLLVGANDELFDANKYEPAVQAVRGDIPAIIVPEVDPTNASPLEPVT